MTIPLPPYTPGWTPVPNVTPFTYRDGVSYGQKFEKLVNYLNRVVIPYVNENYDSLALAFATEVQLLIDAVNAAIELVIEDSIDLQDPVMAAIFENAESATRELVDTLYAGKAIEGVVSGHTTAIADLVADVATNTTAIADLSTSVSTDIATIESEIDAIETEILAIKAVSGVIEHIPAYQITTETLRKWRLALAQAMNDGPIAKVLFIGDSTTLGSETVQDSFPMAFINSLNRQGIKCRSGIVGPATNIADNRWGVTPGWTISGSIGPAGGTWRSAAGNANQLYAAPKEDFTDIAFHYVNAIGGISTVVDGVDVVLTINSSGGAANTYNKVEVAKVGDVDTILGINGPTSGPINILGFESWDDANPAWVAVTNLGQSGVAASDWVNDTASLAAISYVAPSLSVIMLGINDAQASVSTADFISRVDTIVDVAKATGDVIILTFPETDPAFLAGIGPREEEYLEALLEYGDDNDIPVIDVNARMGGYSNYATNPWYRDQIHQSNSANKDIAEVIASVVLP